MKAPELKKLVFITNDPAPYRVPIFDRIARTPDISFQVMFSCKREPNRLWNLPTPNFDHVFLRERFITVNGRYIHNNPDVISNLKRFSPDIVITDGFNPT